MRLPSMEKYMLIQITISGLANGCLYALIGLGFVLIYKATEIVNFSQGEAVMIGGYIGFWLTYLFKLSFVTVYPLAIIGGVLVGYVISRPLWFLTNRKAPLFNIIVATVAIGMIVRSLARLVWSSESRAYLGPSFLKTITISNIVITSENLFVFSITAFFIIIFYLFFFLSKTGTSMRASAQNPDAASLVGIEPKKVFTLTWVIGCALGAIGGVVYGPIATIMPDSGFTIIIKAFAAAVLGGFGSIPGVIVGGCLLGVTENLAGLFIGTALKDLISFIVIILVLILKPSGILGVRIERV